MSSNYPEGVTGNELAIAGPQSEWAGTLVTYCRNEECATFEEELDATGDYWAHDYTVGFSWTCEHCGSKYEEEVNMF